jgi:hypothetical protein
MLLIENALLSQSNENNEDKSHKRSFALIPRLGKRLLVESASNENDMNMMNYKRAFHMPRLG